MGWDPANETDYLNQIIKHMRQLLLEAQFNLVEKYEFYTYQGSKFPNKFRELVARGETINETSTESKSSSSSSIIDGSLFHFSRENLQQVIKRPDSKTSLRRLIIGNTGVGKSELLNYLASDIANDLLNNDGNGSEYSWVFKLDCRKLSQLDLENDNEGSILVDLIMQSYFSCFDNDNGFKFKFFENHLKHLLFENAKHGRILFILDALDEVSINDGQLFEEDTHLVSRLYQRLCNEVQELSKNKQIYIIISSRDYITLFEYKKWNLLFNEFDKLTIEGFSIEGARAFIDEYFLSSNNKVMGSESVQYLQSVFDNETEGMQRERKLLKVPFMLRSVCHNHKQIGADICSPSIGGNFNNLPYVMIMKASLRHLFERYLEKFHPNKSSKINRTFKMIEEVCRDEILFLEYFAYQVLIEGKPVISVYQIQSTI